MRWHSIKIIVLPTEHPRKGIFFEIVIVKNVSNDQEIEQELIVSVMCTVRH